MAARTTSAFGIINFANADMVGHTGVIPAAVKAVETVDACLGDVVAAVHAAGGALLITADHGNADHMLEHDGSPEHRALAQPGAAHRHRRRALTLRDGGASSPTSRRRCSQLLGIEQPAAMTGRSLLRGLAPWPRRPPTPSTASTACRARTFVAERDALAKQLRADGRRDEAAAVKALGKPTVAAWAANQAVRSQKKPARDLWKAGDQLSAAHDAVLAGRARARSCARRPSASAPPSSAWSTPPAGC